MLNSGEYKDYLPSNVRIYEKQIGDYVVYYVVKGDPELRLRTLQYSPSIAGMLRMLKNKKISHSSKSLHVA